MIMPYSRQTDVLVEDDIADHYLTIYEKSMEPKRNKTIKKLIKVHTLQHSH